MSTIESFTPCQNISHLYFLQITILHEHLQVALHAPPSIIHSAKLGLYWA